MANAANDQARKDYGILLDAVSAILFRHDPVGINFETNTDEYDPEARTILPRLRSCESEADVYVVVIEEFRRGFGDDISGNKASYKPIAAEIWRLWSDQPDTVRNTQRGSGDARQTSG